jgi:pimeloyl-ACP methyl ester carboxylesterase
MNAQAIDINGPPNGPSIVLVHGSVVTRKVWGPQMRGLSDTFKMIAPDLPGHGELADTPFGFDSAIERIADVVRQHADGRAVVVGLSLGGYIAIECAARRPDRRRARLQSRPARPVQPRPPPVRVGPETLVGPGQASVGITVSSADMMPAARDSDLSRCRERRAFRGQR